MTDYGLSGVRDAETGERQPVEHTYEWSGEEVTVRLLPPTLDETDDYEDLGDDVDPGRIREILDRHIIKPSPPEDGDWTTREMMCYFQGIMSYSYGDGVGTGLPEEVREEIDARSGEAGGN